MIKNILITGGCGFIGSNLVNHLAEQGFKVFIIDVDGVMTSGHFFYSHQGKYLKCFGPDDNDGLSLLKPYIEVRFITGDKKGFNISKKRIVDDMNFKLDLVSTVKRLDWIKKKFPLNRVIYMGDGILDYLVMNKVLYSVMFFLRGLIIRFLTSFHIFSESLSPC